MRHRLIPAALAIVSFLVTFTILSLQEGRWPFGAASAHSSTTRSAEQERIVPRVLPKVDRSSWSTVRPASASPSARQTDLAAAAAVASVHAADLSEDESSEPQAAPATTRVSGGEYLAERAREAAHGARAH